MKKRTIFIWDIHWCYKELKLLIKKLEIKEGDRVFFTWDYINKWPDSFKVIKYFYKNREQFSWVLGNHDKSFLDKVGQWDDLSKKHSKLLAKMQKHPKIFDFFRKLPYYIEEDNFLLLHAGLNPKKSLKKHTKSEISSIRIVNKEPWYNFYKWDKKVIYGHWAMQWVHIGKNVIWLDSGCCYWGYLSAYVLETWELIQQWSLDQYEKIDYTHINPAFF